MKEVFQYYLTNCYQAMIHQKELTFDFGDYAIVYFFVVEHEIDDEEPFSYYSINDFNDIKLLLERNVSFKSCYIKGIENLGCREDIEDGRSITNEMFYFITKIKFINEEIINNFSIDVVFDEPMCDKYGNYQFTIDISDNYFWDIEFAKYILNLLKSNEICTPDFYNRIFTINKPINDNKIIPILTTSTKVRRLGYFKILSDFFLKYKKVPLVFINKKFETYCLDYIELLRKNNFKKGLISETKTGISAKPYIDLARELGLLNKINNIFHLGKSFKVYQVLQNKYSNSHNVFELSDFDKIYFLECILKNDYFYFSNLLELVFINEDIIYSDLINNYQSQLISRLEEYKDSTLTYDRKGLNNLNNILNRIKGWDSADVYMEHLIMPRINWMFDLGIIIEVDKRYVITEIGNKLFKNLSIWNDINTNKIISPNSFLDRFMIHLYDDCYNSVKFPKPAEMNAVIEKMYGYIEESFDYFKTLAPNRVTASQSVNYTKYKLYLNDNIKVGYQFILDKLSEKDQDKFIFKYQEQYQDGYIQKKK